MVTGDRNEREKKTGGDFAFNYSTAPLALLIEDYQNITKKTVIPDPDVEKNLTQTITFQSLEGQEFTDEERIFTLEMLLEMRGIHLEPYGEKFVRAIPRDKARKDGVPIVADDAEITEGGRVISRFIKLKYVSYEEVQKALEGFKSDKGNFLAFERINTILVTDTELNVARMLEVVKTIDIETPVTEQVFVRQIKNASAQDIQQQLQKIVEESQKEQLEKNGKSVLNAQNQQNSRQPFQNRFGQPRNQQQQQQQQPAATSPQNMLATISDADRGMIRGKVLILADERSNKLIIVTSKTNMDFFDKVIEQLDIETTPDTVVKVYRLKYADAEEVSDMINDLIGNAPSSKSSSKGNQNQTAKKGANTTLTKSVTTAPKSSANQRSGEAKAGELSKENTTILADKRINGLVVMTAKELVPVVESIIEKMDVKLSQVLIETCIIEVNLEDTIKTGVDWVKQVRSDSGNPQAMSGGGGSTANGSALASLAVNGLMDGTTGLPVSKAVGSGLNYFMYNESLNLSAMIEMSKSDTRTKYIASPVVMTLDNKEANIEATDMRYMLTGFTSSGTSYSTVAVPNYEQKEIGITIKVTPKINPNGTVMLTVEEEYSKLGAGQTIQTSSGVTSTSGGNQSSTLMDVSVDTTTTRKMSADIQLEDGQTVILGGLTDTTVSKVDTGIPVLKDIPFIGRYLFGRTEDKETRKELLVFMTPYVLGDGASAQAEALRRKNALSESRPWEDNGWSRSPLADPVSSKELVRRQSDEWKKQDEELENAKKLEKAREERVAELLKRYGEESESPKTKSSTETDSKPAEPEVPVAAE